MSSRIEAAEQRAADAARRVADAQAATVKAQVDLNRALDELADFLREADKQLNKDQDQS